MFTDEMKGNLAAPLTREHVKKREQSGRSFSYVEGWHVIAEANRIFGFDGWISETVDIRMVAERPRKIRDRDGWGVSYTAKVRIDVGGVVREGIGAGHGIDADLGLAHESAIKEAETDARKRALMTFGNPFGLALYDKEQSNVADPPPAPTSDDLYVKHALAKIEAFDSEAALNEWYKAETEARQRLLDSDQIALLFGKARDKRKALRPAAPASEAA